jgi:hypothetical protein
MIVLNTKSVLNAASLRFDKVAVAKVSNSRRPFYILSWLRTRSLINYRCCPAYFMLTLIISARYNGNRPE